jgi:heat shock protein HslJ
VTDTDNAAPPSAAGSWSFLVGHAPDGALAPIPGHPITLEVEGDRWAGSAGCNRYTTTVTRDAGRVVLPRGIATTLMACADDVAAVERAYLAALPLVTTIGRTADRLTLRGEGVELVFEPSPAAPDGEALGEVPAGDEADDAGVAGEGPFPLVGTTWSIVRLVGAEEADPPLPAVGAPWLLLGEDGAVTGAAGCNRLMGHYEREGTTLRIGPLATTRMACPEPAMVQEASILRILSGATVEVARLGGGVRLVGSDGAALDLQATDATG